METITPPLADEAWPTEWVRSALPLLTLHALRSETSYGYALTTTLGRSGFTAVRGAQLYPLLGRQADAGLITTQWRAGDGGPGRKYFGLTADGRVEADRLRHEWTRFTAAVDRFTTLERRAA